MKNIYKKLLAILAIYLVIFILFQPQKKNFPLNDDWVYSYSVSHFLDTGAIKINDWNAATTVFQIWWGILFSKVFGFSLGNLKIAVLILSFAGAIFSFLMLEQLKYKHTLFPVILLIFNPIYFLLSVSFMSDVPYLSMFIAAVYFYLKGILEDREGYVFIGSIFAAFAYLTRQLGILIPVGIFCYFIFFDRKKLSIKSFFTIILVPLLVFIAHWYWFNYIHGLTWVSKAGLVSALAPDKFYFRFVSALFYFGLFALPYSFIKSIKTTEKLSMWKPLAVISLSFLLFIHLLVYNVLPFFDNSMHKSGLGTLTISGMGLKDAFLLSSNNFWIILTILCGISVILVFNKLLKGNFSKGELIVIISCLIQFFVSAIRFKFFDRYLLVLLPLAVLFAAKFINFKKLSAKIVFSMILIFMTAYSFLGTKDYLTWNHAKWDLGNKLISDFGYKPEEIANGFDWDGFYTFQPNIEKLLSLKVPKDIGDWEWQSLNPYKVIVSYDPAQPKYLFVADGEYYDWLAFKQRKLYAWKLQN